MEMEKVVQNKAPANIAVQGITYWNGIMVAEKVIGTYIAE